VGLVKCVTGGMRPGGECNGGIYSFILQGKETINQTKTRNSNKDSLKREVIYMISCVSEALCITNNSKQ